MFSTGKNAWHTILENIKFRIPEQIRQQCDALEQRCLHEIKALKVDDMFIGLTNWILEDVHEKILELLTNHYMIDRDSLGLTLAIVLPEDGWVTRMIGFLSFD